MSDANRRISLTLQHVQRVLFEIWDPIDVKAHAPRDEYAQYAPAVLEHIWAGGSRKSLIRLLDAYVDDDMSLKPPPGRSAMAADALLGLRDGLP